jgi:hypothetical protein
MLQELPLCTVHLCMAWIFFKQASKQSQFVLRTVEMFLIRTISPFSISQNHVKDANTVISVIPNHRICIFYVILSDEASCKASYII